MAFEDRNKLSGTTYFLKRIEAASKNKNIELISVKKREEESDLHKIDTVFRLDDNRIFVLV